MSIKEIISELINHSADISGIDALSKEGASKHLMDTLKAKFKGLLLPEAQLSALSKLMDMIIVFFAANNACKTSIETIILAIRLSEEKKASALAEIESLEQIISETLQEYQTYQPLLLTDAQAKAKNNPAFYAVPVTELPHPQVNDPPSGACDLLIYFYDPKNQRIFGYQLPSTWKFYQEAGWVPPKAFIDAVTDPELEKIVHYRVFRGASRFANQVEISEKLFDRMCANGNGDDKRPDKWCIASIGFLTGTVTPSGRCGIFDLHTWVDHIDEGSGTVAEFIPPKLQDKRLQTFWRTLDHLNAEAKKYPSEVSTEGAWIKGPINTIHHPLVEHPTQELKFFYARAQALLRKKNEKTPSEQTCII